MLVGNLSRRTGGVGAGYTSRARNAMTEVLTLTMLKQKVRDAVLVPANYRSTGTASACSKVKHNSTRSSISISIFIYASVSALPGHQQTRLLDRIMLAYLWNTRSRLGKNNQQLSMYLYYKYNSLIIEVWLATFWSY